VILLRLWKQNELITEQAVGHTLQHLLTLTEKLTARKKRLNQLEAGHHNSPPPKQA
jgi:hypothetical protein